MIIARLGGSRYLGSEFRCGDVFSRYNQTYVCLEHPEFVQGAWQVMTWNVSKNQMEYVDFVRALYLGKANGVNIKE